MPSIAVLELTAFDAFHNNELELSLYTLKVERNIRFNMDGNIDNEYVKSVNIFCV